MQTMLAGLPEDKAWFGKAPTLATVRKTYGDGAPATWLIGQLGNLSEFCGVTKKLSDAQIRELAVIIANEYYYMKVSELMLFFIRFKAGHYGQMYGNVDPLRITTALLEFKDERHAAYARHDRENALRRLTEQQQGITYEQWQAKKAQKLRSKAMQGAQP